MGMGHGGQRAGSFLLEKIRLGDGVERAHSPNHAEGRRKRHFSHRDIDSISAAPAGESGFARAHDSAGGATEKLPGNYGRERRGWAARAGGGRFEPGMSRRAHVPKPNASENKY